MSADALENFFEGAQQMVKHGADKWGRQMSAPTPPPPTLDRNYNKKNRKNLQEFEFFCNQNIFLKIFLFSSQTKNK